MGDGGNNSCSSSMAGGEVNANLSSSNGIRSVQAIIPNSQFSNWALILTLVSSLLTKFYYLPFEKLESKILLRKFVLFCRRFKLVRPRKLYAPDHQLCCYINYSGFPAGAQV